MEPGQTLREHTPHTVIPYWQERASLQFCSLLLQPPPASHGGWGGWLSLHTPLPAVLGIGVFLFYPVRLADQPLHCPRARAVYLLGGHVLSAQRDSNVQNSAQSQSLHFRWGHFLHGVENSSIFLPPLNYQHLYKGTFPGNPL